MSIEELLKPRYKVIAEDTSGNFRIGDMFLKSNYDDWFESGTYEMPEWELKKYPHLFKKLEWHEERKESEMPEYVVLNNQWRKDFNTPAKVLKVEKSDNGIFLTVDKVNDLITRLHVENFYPATEEEYIQYQQNKKQ